MQEKQALAQLRDAQLIVSMSHIDKSESRSRPSSVNLANPVDLEWSAIETKPPSGDEPAGTCSESGWVYFAGICTAECSDSESAAVSRLNQHVPAGGTRVASGSHALLSKLHLSEVT